MTLRQVIPLNLKPGTRAQLVRASTRAQALRASALVLTLLLLGTCNLAALWWYWSNAPHINGMRRFLGPLPHLAFVSRSHILFTGGCSVLGITMRLSSNEWAVVLSHLVDFAGAGVLMLQALAACRIIRPLAAAVGLRVSPSFVALLPIFAPIYFQMKLNRVARILEEEATPHRVEI